MSGILSALIVVLIFGVSIGAVYSFVLPKFFPGWATSSPLVVGLVAAMLIGGYIGYLAPATNKRPDRVISVFCYAAAIAGLVLFLSFFIILNTRGS